jgi:hypothetical protein
MEERMNKALIALLAFGLATPAMAQNAPMPTGPTNGPPGTQTQDQHYPNLPPSTTGTARPSSLGSASGAEAAARYKIEQGGFTSVRGLSHTSDGAWSGRAVRKSDGVEIAVSLQPDGTIVQQ